MKKSGQCPKCGSRNIVADAKAVDRGDGNVQHELSVATFLRPEALIFKQRQMSSLSAWVCGECGFVEFYADAPGVIRLP
jgi:predicted nucleic-acid-binding Zn-ribbon protein